MPTKDGKQTRKEKREINKANYAKMREETAKEYKIKAQLQESKIEAARNSDDFFDGILEEMLTGKSLSQILDENKARWSFYEKLKKDEKFAKKYQDVRNLANEIKFESASQIADKEPRRIVDAQGNMIYDKSELEWRKLRLETIKWELAKREPKKYGDKLELAGDKENPLTINVNR